MSPGTVKRTLALLLGLLAAGCVTQDDARVQQLLNQRGFGARFVGDTNEQYYLGIGDQFSVIDHEHPEFDQLYAIRSDGMIDVDPVGEVFVAGLTMRDCEETLRRRFREFNTTADPKCSLIASTSKYYYVDGMVRLIGRRPFAGDVTLFTAVFESVPTILANVDAVQLIRADPYHPLVVEFDYDDMMKGGWSKANVEVRENDIIYVPPNVFGWLTIWTAKIFAPLNVVVYSVLGLDRLIYATETFGDTRRYQGYGYGGRYGGTGYGPDVEDDLALRLAPIDPTLLNPGGG